MATRVAVGPVGVGSGFGVGGGLMRLVEVGTLTGTVTFDREGETVTEPTADIDAVRVQAEGQVAGLITVRAKPPGRPLITRRYLAALGDTLNEQEDFPTPIPVDPSTGQVIRYQMAYMNPQRVIAYLIETNDPPITPGQAIRAMIPNPAHWDDLVRQYDGPRQRALRDRYLAHRARVVAELEAG